MIRAAVLFLGAAAGPAFADGPRFLDRSAALPVAHVYDGGWEHFVGGGVAVFDCNGDGFPEIAAAGGTNPARLFVNVTDSPGAALAFAEGALPPLTGVTGIWPLDIDGDARLDLAVLRVGGNLFLRGDGDCGFVDATAGWGIDPGDGWSTAFSATWEPGQRWPTLAIGNYVDRADPEGPFGRCDANALFRPEGHGYAAPIALEPGYCALSALFSDWQRRGRADLRLSNDRHYYVREGAEQMWRMAPLRLLGAEDGFDPVSIWGMGIASADITGDGRPDVMLTSMGDQLLMLSVPEGYAAAAWEMGTYATRPHLGDDGRPSTGWHAEFGDVDNDGRLDLFIAKGNVDQMPENAMRDPNNLLMQAPDGRFVEFSADAGIASMARARGAALADLNADGRLDLVVVNRRAPMELWENVTAAGRWLAVTVRQRRSNTFAVGAWVELRLPDGRIVTREVTVGGGHGGGQAGPLHFGLGAVLAVELRVIWPDGAVSWWVTVPAGGRVEVWRDAGAGLRLR
ncbi:MAG: CRTAC1 family protein [Pseudomonadota bacterium]